MLRGKYGQSVGHRYALVPVVLSAIDRTILLLRVQHHREQVHRIVPRPKASPVRRRAELAQELAAKVVRPIEREKLPTDVILWLC